MADALVALLILMILFALSLPAIQMSREQARATQCSNNLKKIVLGLHNYLDTYKTFPAGAMNGGRKDASERMGPSWWYGVLPFLEQRNVYDKIATTQRTGFRPPSIPFNAQAINESCDNMLAAFEPAFMRCPSSPLPVMEQANGPIVLPTYVGISGGCDVGEYSSDYVAEGSFPELKAPSSRWIYNNRSKGLAPHDGIVTSSGMLPPCQHTTTIACLDGTSNTIIVGEQSDWLRDADLDNPAKFHGDAGWDTNGTAGTGAKDGGGFLSGTAASIGIPRIQPSSSTPAPWGVDCYNVTTVRYRVNAKHVLGARPHPGCSEDHGPNNPLQSAHPGGALVGFVDGSVLPLSEDVELSVLLRLAIRDDGDMAVRLGLAIRRWRDNTGNYSVEAELVKLEEETVLLRRADNGPIVKVPIERLSDFDRCFVQTQRLGQVKPRYRPPETPFAAFTAHVSAREFDAADEAFQTFIARLVPTAGDRFTKPEMYATLKFIISAFRSMQSAYARVGQAERVDRHFAKVSNAIEEISERANARPPAGFLLDLRALRAVSALSANRQVQLEEMRQLVNDLKSHLAGKAAQDLTMTDLHTAVALANALEQTPHVDLAQETYEFLAKTAGQSKNESLRRAAGSFAFTAGRLRLGD